ncbi:hypothetical protein [Macrococcus sp. DPC7161]|uniref:hypothetical protein n=1 Tax=Macrococcus sp. DPC7161 TaxID=2507060 RepID=UPI00100BB088|nr:hypothetical protein [Macrococcus sp. DPC7161]RXK19065.1 hypothetical protein ER639_01760 [Macrococcus sp. DPC7161]
MKIFTVEDYLEMIRREYVNEKIEPVRIQWLKLGLTVKAMIDEGQFKLYDEAGERFEDELYKRMR